MKIPDLTNASSVTGLAASIQEVLVELTNALPEHFTVSDVTPEAPAEEPTDEPEAPAEEPEA